KKTELELTFACVQMAEDLNIFTYPLGCWLIDLQNNQMPNITTHEDNSISLFLRYTLGKDISALKKLGKLTAFALIDDEKTTRCPSIDISNAANDAIFWLEKYKAEAPKDLETLQLLCSLYKKIGDHKIPKSLFRELIELDAHIYHSYIQTLHPDSR